MGALLSPLDLVRDLVGEISVITVLFLLRIVGFDIFARFARLVRVVRVTWSSVVLRRRYELVYTDADDEGMTTRRLAEALQRERGGNTRVVALGAPEDLLDWPLRRGVAAVLLLVTDVSPLSARTAVRDSIQERLVRFVNRGGTLVVGHDALYRRSRNHILQRFYGVTLTDFRARSTPVTYVREPSRDCGPVVEDVLRRLPERFELDDAEVVSGDWSAATAVLYRSEPAGDGPAVPLVTYQACGDGHAFWVNSGDHTKHGPPGSVARPQAAFVALLTALLDGAGRPSPTTPAEASPPAQPDDAALDDQGRAGLDDAVVPS